MAAAAAGERRFVPVRGTSFAAPLVAGLLAGLRAGAPDAHAALERLAARAHPPAGDPPADGYGRGLVGEALATSPDAVPLVRAR
jgi:subtilisin family serine protease